MRREWRGAVELDVSTSKGTIRALAYPELTGRPQPGDRLLLNTSALALGLGTGGYALAVALPDRLPADPPGPGHLVKARYTPLQATVLGAEEPDSPHFEALREADDLAGLPVVTADLHSALPAVLAAWRRDPGQTTGRAPAGRRIRDDRRRRAAAWFSRTVAGLREADWLCGSVTVGQAFGGDLEAVSVHSGCSPPGRLAEVDRHPGPRQSRHRHPLGLLRRRLRRGGQRGRDPRRPARRRAARLRGGCP